MQKKIQQDILIRPVALVFLQTNFPVLNIITQGFKLSEDISFSVAIFVMFNFNLICTKIHLCKSVCFVPFAATTNLEILLPGAGHALICLHPVLSQVRRG